MKLKEIYRPIAKELAEVERMIGSNIKSSGNKSILMLGSYLLHSGGKRLRPALVTLSAGAVMSDKPAQILNQVIKVASAGEMIKKIIRQVGAGMYEYRAKKRKQKALPDKPVPVMPCQQIAQEDRDYRRGKKWHAYGL